MEIEELRRLAAKEELSLNYIAKDEIISKVLLELQKIENIILKGGTAVNRVYVKNKRFSEDLDFDIVFKGSLKRAVPLTKDIMVNIKGFNIEGPRIMNYTIRYDLFYTNPLSHKDRIRLEFKAVKNASNYSKKIVNFGFVPYDSSLLNVYEIEELIRHKIECILGRIEGKDFFDLYYLLEQPHKNLNLSKRLKQEIIKRIELEEKEIKSVETSTNHCIPKNKRHDWRRFLEELKEKIGKC